MSTPDADVLFLGDLCFGASYKRPADENRYFHPSFANLSGLLEQAGLVVANLETTLTTEKTSPLEGKKRLIHKDGPPGAEALKRHGIDVVSLGNNHAFDYGASGFSEMLDCLRANDIEVIGAGLTRKQARRNMIRDLSLPHGNFRLAVAAGKQHVNYSYPYYADKNHPGINGWKRKSSAAQIQALRQAEPDAFIIAFPHWGKNYRWKVNYQSKLARAMIEAGADLVLGHGAHCLQEIEQVEGRWVVHSIGNSVFNTPGGFRKYPDILPYSFLARLCVAGAGQAKAVALRLYPILSDNRRTKYCPRFVEEKELRLIRNALVARNTETKGFDEALISGQDDYGWFLELSITSAGAQANRHSP